MLQVWHADVLRKPVIHVTSVLLFSKEEEINSLFWLVWKWHHEDPVTDIKSRAVLIHLLAKKLYSANEFKVVSKGIVEAEKQVRGQL